jgi:hypothetical protein
MISRWRWLAGLVLAACSSSPEAPSNGSVHGTGANGVAIAGAGIPIIPTAGTSGAIGLGAGGTFAAGSSAVPTPTPIARPPSSGTGAFGAAGAPANPFQFPLPTQGGAAGMASLPAATPGALGPDDGDPNAPVVALPSIACGGPTGFGIGTPNLQVDMRDVILTYPCNKHEGANVTFILLLHGTNSDDATKLYTHNYFAAWKLASTSNLIIAEPKAIGSQWGNVMETPDASMDKPYLLDVINYVYTNFPKVNITSLWIAGHSWGAIYAKWFACDPTVKDHVRGVIGMSGGASSPGGVIFGGSVTDLMPTSNCTDYISQIHTVGDMDMVTGLPDQTAAATKHGCGAKMGPTDIGNMQMLDTWPNCTAGWAHEDFTMGAHMHTTPINPEVVQQIIDTVKSTEKR